MALIEDFLALSVLEPTGDTYGLAATWEGRGVANHGLGLHVHAEAGR
jgi:hypothetical protein